MKVFLSVIGAAVVSFTSSVASATTYEWATATDSQALISSDANWKGGVAPNLWNSESGREATLDFSATPVDAAAELNFQQVYLSETNVNIYVGTLIGDNRRYFHYPYQAASGRSYRGHICQRVGLSIYVTNPNAFYGRIGMSDYVWVGSTQFKRPGIVLEGATGGFEPILHDVLVNGRPHFCVPAGGSGIIENLVGAGPFDVNMKPTTSLTGQNTPPEYFAGTLAISNAPGAQSTAFLHGGTLRLSGVAAGRALVPVASPAAHYDASAPGGVEYDGAKKVTRWLDLSGKARHLTPEQDIAAPTFRPGAGETGLAVVDFGAFKGSHHDQTVSAENLATFGDPAALQAASAFGGIREVFVVYKENQISKSSVSLIGSYNDTSKAPPFYRTGSTGTTENGLTHYQLLTMGRKYNTPAALGEIRYDGQRIEGQYTPRNAAYGYHVFSVGLTNGAAGGWVKYLCSNSFNEHKSYPRDIGGARIGEVICYDRSLSPDERRQVNAYLKHKWCRGQDARDWDLGAVYVERPATVDVPAGRVATIGTLDLTQSGATLTKTGEGVLRVARVFPLSATIQCQGGSIEYEFSNAPSSPSAPAENPNFWLDATEIPTEYILSSNDSSQVARQFVTAWPDRRGQNHLGQSYAACRCVLNPNSQGANYVDYGKYMAYATLRNDAPTGLPLVDFGSYWNVNLSSSLTTPGAWENTGRDTAFYRFQNSAVEGQGSVPNLKAREFFMVLTLKNANAQILGQVANTMETMRDSQNVIGGLGPSGTQFGGTWYINGKEVDPLATKLYSNTCIVLNGAFVEGVDPRAFGSDRGYSFYGGIAIGEFLTYERRLTDEERRETTSYLLQKWLAKPHPDVGEAGYLTANATVVRHAAGVGEGVALGETATGLPILEAVSGENTFTFFHPALSNLIESARTHLDAAHSGGFTYSTRAGMTVDADGDRYITRWSNLAGTRYFSKSPVEDEGTEKRSSDGVKIRYVQAYPTVKAYTYNGVTRPYVDLGELSSSIAPTASHNTNENAYENAWGTRPTTAAMVGNVSGALTGREYHLVFGDAHPNVETPANPWHPAIMGRGNCLNSPDYIPGRRGINGELFAQNKDSTVAFRDGRVWVDNTVTNSTYKPDWGEVHVYTLVPTTSFAETPADNDGVYAIGIDSYIRWGGSRYGEIVVFSGATNTAEDRAEIDAYLLKKWTGKGLGPKLSLGSVTVANEATLTLASAQYGNFFQAESIGGAGTLGLGAGDTLKTAAVAGTVDEATRQFGTLTVDGTLMLADSGTLTLSGTTRPKVGTHTILAADSLEGDLSGWQVELDFPYEGVTPTVEVVDNAIKLTMPSRGLLMIVR